LDVEEKKEFEESKNPGEWPWISRQKLTLFAVTLIVVGLTWSIFDTEPESGNSPFTQVIELDLPDQPVVTETRLTPKPGIDSVTNPIDQWQTVTVKPGQTLDAIFRQQRFSVSLLHRILALNADTKGLTRIRPGETFEFKRDPDGELSVMRYPLDEERYLLVRQSGEDLQAYTQQRMMSSEIRESEGIIKSSLFLAAKGAGLSDNMIMKLANIFGWDIDFVLDIRKGDRFMLVYEKIYRDGEFLRDGNILAATFINQGQRFQAIWYEKGEIEGFFAPDGRPMRKAFLRAPLNFSYISSSFNPRRMHPVLKRIRPHNGIDYYAPKGTPVYAAGAGKVIRSDYSRANGHHVFIKHANSIVTKYLHFTKRAVNNGQKVKQGQTIGYVGSTGLATGPHLHYEFVLNGVHRNPRTVPLPKVEPLAGKLLTGFQQKAAPMLTQLSRLESASLYAQRQ
jgi:murein DD-endopeptidase MepM/ murein hydrolase activator NlpD